MNALEENSIREQLERAVNVIDPVAPPLDALRARSGRRKRNRRALGGFMVLAVAGAAVAIIVAVVAIAPAGNDRVQIASPPTQHSLVSYAKTHGGLKIGGPFEAGSTWYGAFSTKQAIVVVRYAGAAWHVDGPAVTALGKGQLVTRLGKGPPLGQSTPSIAVRTIGGDVGYFGSVLRRAGGRWRPANFGGCGHHGLCYTPSNSESYGHVVKAGFVSIQNTCTPNCAAGTNYRVTWRWSQPARQFLAQSERVVKQ